MPYLKILNPHKDLAPEDNSTMVQTRLDPTVFNYFFRAVLVGSRGYRQALICQFFDALHKACLAQSIPASFDELNEHRIATLLSHLNFSPDSVSNLLAKFPTGFVVNPDGSVDELTRSERPTSDRRPDSPTPERKKKPKARDSVNGGTNSMGD